MKYLDFLGKSLKINDEIIATQKDGFGGEFLVKGKVSSLFVNPRDTKIIGFKEKDIYSESYACERQVMKIERTKRLVDHRLKNEP